MSEGVMAALLRILRQPAFLVCVGVLVSSAVGMRIAADKLDFYLRKEPVALQKPLDEVDKNKLWPYKLVKSTKIEDEAVVETLGTQDYVQWILEDTRAGEKDPARLIHLFITYYTGDPDAIPHVPDWCYIGGGAQIVESFNTSIQSPNRSQDDPDEIPVRVLSFQMSNGLMTVRKPVVYFFRVNGDYRCTRDAVRLRVNSIFDRHAYFSKVEFDFMGAQITPDEAVAAVEKLAKVIVPVMEEDHWPDWSAVKASEKRGEIYTTGANSN